MPRDPAQHPQDDRVRVSHMLTAARDVLRLAEGRERGHLGTDMALRRAMIHAIQEIGEAGTKVSPLFRAQSPGVPWSVIVGMRNRLVHGYDSINLDTVWLVATQEIKPLIGLLEAAIGGASAL